MALPELYAAVARAVDRTLRERHLAQSESSVKELGGVQERMLDVESSRSPAGMDVCFHPKHAAGGDFFSHFRPAPGRLFCLLTDVSGHDLQAAYISSYFQGVVRGMLECAAPMDEIFTTFNRLLLEEWGQAEAFIKHGGIGASVAACAILIDSPARTATTLAYGTPAPVYWQTDGTARVMGNTGGFPLGWFPSLSSSRVVVPIPEGGSFCLWTDGLEEVAGKIGVSELSLAYALQKAKESGEKLGEIEYAADDILLADVHLSLLQEKEESFRPLVLEKYHGGQTGEIDEFQSFWERSLLLAVPRLSPAKLHDVLLASRETLLNALQHGCDRQPGRSASFQAAYSAQSEIIRIRVCDPGPGHQFDADKHEGLAADELLAEHRGLILAKHLSTRIDSERNGATILMDFA